MDDDPVDGKPEKTGPLQPKTLHPSALVFDLLSHARQFLVPAIIALFSAARGELYLAIFALIFLAPAVLQSVFRYFTLRYMIADGELIVRKGLIFRSLRTIPVNRIQNVDLVQNVMHRLLGVAEVRVETASGKESEARLRVLSLKQVEALRKEIFEEQEATAGQPGPDQPGPAVAEIPSRFWRAAPSAGRTLLTIPFRQLVLAGLASNRGMLLIGVLVGLYWQVEPNEQFDVRGLMRFLPKFDGSLANVLLWLALLAVAFLVLRVLGVFWYVLRFYNYRLSRHGEDLRVACGLFTRVSATIPRKRIQFISIHRTLIMKWMGLAAVRIETAGGGGSEAENASSSVSRRWFVPVVSESLLPGVLGELRDGLTLDEPRLPWQPLAPNALPRLMRMAILKSVVVAVAGFLLNHMWGWIAGLVALPLMIWWARRKSCALRYCRTGDKMVYRSGVLNRKTSLTFYDKVQATRVNQTPFDRRWNQARLVIDTAAAGPAEHLISIPFLEARFASSELQGISENAGKFQPDFG